MANYDLCSLWHQCTRGKWLTIYRQHNQTQFCWRFFMFFVFDMFSTLPLLSEMVDWLQSNSWVGITKPHSEAVGFSAASCTLYTVYIFSVVKLEGFAFTVYVAAIMNPLRIWCSAHIMSITPRSQFPVIHSSLWSTAPWDPQLPVIHSSMWSPRSQLPVIDSSTWSPRSQLHLIHSSLWSTASYDPLALSCLCSTAPCDPPLPVIHSSLWSTAPCNVLAPIP